MFSALKRFAHLGEITEIELSNFTARQFVIASLPTPFILNVTGNRQAVEQTTVVNEQ